MHNAARLLPVLQISVVSGLHVRTTTWPQSVLVNVEIVLREALMSNLSNMLDRMSLAISIRTGTVVEQNRSRTAEVRELAPPPAAGSPIVM